MAVDAEIFSLSSGDPEDAWLHGRANARAWASGRLRADDEFEFSAELDAQMRAEVGVDVADDLAALDGEAAIAGHIGLRLQAGAPMDLFAGAGLIVKARAEVSGSAQISVTASMSLARIHDQVLEDIPQNVSYTSILLDQMVVRAGVWARCSFAAMATGELVSAISLYPTDGSRAGVTASFRYGYAWIFGGGWGTIVNVGVEPDALLASLCDQLSWDITHAIDSADHGPAVDPDSVVGWLRGAANIIIPATLRTLVRIGRIAVTDDGDTIEDELIGLLNSVAPPLIDYIVNRLLAAIAAAFAADGLDNLGAAAYASAWSSVSALLASRDVADPDNADRRGFDVLGLLFGLADSLPASARDDAKSGLRCVSALLLLSGAQSADRNALVSMFPGVDVMALTPRGVAATVLPTELVTVMERYGILPSWLSSLVGDSSRLAALLISGRTADRSDDHAAVTRLLTTITQSLFQQDFWKAAVGTLSTNARLAIDAAVSLLVEFATADRSVDRELPMRRLREGLTVCIMTLVGQPLATVVRTVADAGMRAAPPAFRALADRVEVGNFPPSLSWTWEDLGRAIIQG